jgi:hypothetical protein
MDEQTVRAGFLRRVGWEKHEDTGEDVFRAVIEYPNGPPDNLRFSLVWEPIPVAIVPLPETA